MQQRHTYLYFGASVIWRASAGKWPDYIGKTWGSLGDKYQEELRRFLLGETCFPSNIYLGVYVDRDKDILPKVAFPAHQKYPGHHIHFFYIPGIKFVFTIGSVTGAIGRMFEKEKTRVLFVEYFFKKSKDFQALAGATKILTPKGRLAKDVKSRFG